MHIGPTAVSALTHANGSRISYWDESNGVMDSTSSDVMIAPAVPITRASVNLPPGTSGAVEGGRDRGEVEEEVEGEEGEEGGEEEYLSDHAMAAGKMPNRTRTGGGGGEGENRRGEGRRRRAHGQVEA